MPSIVRNEKGQSLVEVSVGVVLLLLIVIIVFEAGLVFSTYVALLNAAREGAAYASTCDLPLDEKHKAAFIETIQKEAETSGLDPNKLQITGPNTDLGVERGNPVTVIVGYELVTFTSTIRLPFFGRFGLPGEDGWPISATAHMPYQLEG